MNPTVVYKEHPLVSVVIPAFNADQWISKTLESACSQSYAKLEIIVVNDGSTDQTVDQVISAAVNDPRIHLVNQANNGVGRARNRGVEEAQGSLIAFLDADDLWHPDKILKQVNCFLQHKANRLPVGMVYCGSQTIDKNGDVIRAQISSDQPTGQVFEKLLNENFLNNGSTPLICRTAFEETDGFMEDREASGCADWALYLRIARNYHVYAVNEVLVGYRRAEGSMSDDYQKMVVAHEYLVKDITAHLPATPPHLIRNSRSLILLWLAAGSSIFSEKFKYLFKLLFENDPLFLFRRKILRLIYLTCINRISKLFKLADLILPSRRRAQLPT